MSDNLVQKFAGSHPPEFSNEEILGFAEQLYGVSGELTPLWGERDQNLMITSPDHNRYVLKISNVLENEDNIDFQIKALQHLSVHAPDISVPRVIALKEGDLITSVKGREGEYHLVHLISLLPGVSLPDHAYRHNVLKAIGKQAGQAALGLRGFIHAAAASQEMFWDLRHLASYSDFVPHVSDEGLRRAIESFIPEFCSQILPRLSGLRSQVIHHDTNPSNVLVDPENPEHVTGLIDFGDMIFGPIVQDVAVATSELTNGAPDDLDKIASVVQGYDSALPLEEAEIDLLYDMILAREVQGTLIGIARNRSGVCSVDNKDYGDLYGPSMEQLLKNGREKTISHLRSVCRFAEYFPGVQLPSGTNSVRTKDLIARRYRTLGESLSLSYESPLHTVRGEGVWLYDVDGRRYLDCYNNVPHVGHCHPHVVKAISRQAAALNTNTRYVFESVVTYAERLGGMMPGDLSVCLYVNSGSEANDLALRMAKTVTGQTGAIVVEGAYHGITNEIYALSDANDWGMSDEIVKSHPALTRSDIETIANPDTVRGPYGRDDPDAGAKYAVDADRAIATLADSGHPVGAFMMDSAFSTHGILDVPDGYVQGVAERVRAAGGLIIGDEVQYGFGRSGNHMWGFENYGITPDFVTLGKPIGNGIALGVVVTTPEILKQFTEMTDFFSTFGGNPVACNAALAVVDVIEEEGLLENCRITGEYLRDGLRAVSQGSGNIGDIRGKGLFVGVDVVSDPDAMTPDGKERARIQNHLRDNGFLVGSEGQWGHLLKIRPSMVFQKEHADMFVETFGKAISAR